MASVMVTGRAAAAIAAELATMKVSEQIDALEVMAVDPMEFLVLPRVMAGFVMMPLLSVFFCAVASVTSALIACNVQGMDPSVYWNTYARFVDGIEIIHCLVKGSFFGGALCWVACFFGMRARGGAHAVGSATRNTVVVSCLLVLLLDYILTSLLPMGLARLKVT
jgi:phospholipid/cholesterol/gamma-HCH transport system permease protein